MLVDLPLDAAPRLPPRRAPNRPTSTTSGPTPSARRAARLARPLRAGRHRSVPVEVYDVTFAGFGGHPVRGWLHAARPARAGRCRASCEYIGYGGGRGLPHEAAAVGLGRLRALRRWTPAVRAAAGRVGDTPDPDGRRGPAHPGFMTRGIARPAHVLLPPGLHRRRAGGRRGARPPAGRRRTGSRSPAAARAAASRSRPPALVDRLVGGRCPTCRSCATSGGRPRSATRTRTRRSPRYLKVHRDHVERGVPHAVLLRRRRSSPRGARAGAVLGRR